MQQNLDSIVLKCILSVHFVVFEDWLYCNKSNGKENHNAEKTAYLKS